MNESVKLTTKLHQRDECYIFWCPGCECGHIYFSNWNFNQNIDKPTFTPSLLNWNETSRCHLFLTDGKIHYCNDCTHSLAGKIVDMENIPENYGT
jgi:hypothetical protein